MTPTTDRWWHFLLLAAVLIPLTAACIAWMWQVSAP